MDADRPRGLLRELRPYLRQVGGLLVVGSVAGVVMNTAVVLPPVLLGRAIDTAVAMDRGQAAAGELTRAALLFIAATVLTELPRIGKRWWLGVARARIRATVRSDALRGVLGWPVDRLHRTAVGDVVARIIGDVEVLGTGLSEIIVETWDTLLFSAALIAAILVYDPELAAVALLPVPLALLLAKVSGRWVAGRTLAARRANAGLTVFIAEHLAAVRVIQAFGRSDATVAAMSDRAAALAEAQLSATRLGSVLQPSYAALISSGAIAVLWIGADRVVAGAMSVGALVAFLQLWLRFTARAYRIPQMANRIQAARAAYGRLAPLLAPAVPGNRWSSWRTRAIPGSSDATRPVTEVACQAAFGVVLDDVDFCYPGAADPALRQVSLSVSPGAMIAITGTVGSGKTALAAVIAGLYPVTGGLVRVDGHDPYGWTAGQRDRLGYLPQNDVLFAGTVRDNISLSDVDDDPVRYGKAVTVAGLAADLAGWSLGDQTPIGELGVRVSGGQRQRIGLARALVAPRHPPRLVVLDDPFSAVDVATEASIIEALREYAGPSAPPAQRATIVLCSTRLAAFAQADHVVVLDRGRIVEQGRHEDLLRTGGRYARIYQAQQRIRGRDPASRR